MGSNVLQVPSKKIVQEVLTVWQAESARSEESDVTSWERGCEQQRAKNFSGVDGESRRVASDSTFVCSRGVTRTLRWLYPFPPTRGLYYHQFKYVRERLRPSHRRACLSTPFAAIHRKKNPPRRILSGKLAHWNKLCRSKTTSRLLPLTSFGVKSPQKKQTLPPHLSHRLMMKHPPDRQLPADTSLTCGYLITSPVRGTSNSKRILRNTCWTFGAAPENIIGFLVCSWKDRLTDTAEW